MANFKYKCLDINGKVVKGNLTADSIHHLKYQLKINGMLLVDAKETHERQENQRVKIFKRKKMLKSDELGNLCSQLAIISSSGVSVITSLEILIEQASSKLMKSELTRLYKGMQMGKTMAEIMSENNSGFPELLAGMVNTGESSGTLDKVFRSMSNYYMKDGSIRKKIKSALIYPTLLLVMAVGLIIGFLKFVLPSIIDIILENGMELPTITKFVISLSTFVGKYYLLIITVIIILIPLVKTFFKSSKGKLIKDTVLMRVPVLQRAIRNIETSRFSQGINLLMISGFPLMRGLELLAKSSGNVLAERAIRIAIQGIQKGETLTDNLRKGNFFDKMFLQMLLVGEQTGSIGAITDEMSEYYGREVDVSITRAMSLIEPIMMIIIGAIVGFLVISVALPMFSMYEAFE